ncbi:HSP18 transcriptional regulator [Catenulispora subtropica]|uniref:HSP18 transcriptional regulator n=1 Tax=Catenulispora subtropica TaxID=450798 RepID=A0ABP5CML5_9ACTN
MEKMPITQVAPGEAGFDTGAALGQITAAMHAMHAMHAPAVEPGVPAPAALNANQVLAALTLLRELRTEIAGWEPQLIEAARALNTSWADLAPALGVASRQAAEKRYLRLRPAADGTEGTREERVAAERDRRAGDKAVAGWARDNAAGLRQLAGQIGALTDLGTGADGDLAVLHAALGRDDAADLLEPLAGTRGHLAAGHPGLADQVGAVSASVAEVRAASDRSRRPGA